MDITLCSSSTDIFIVYRFYMPALERVKKKSSQLMFNEVEKCHFPYTAPFCTSYSATTVLQPRPPEKIDLMIEITLVVDSLTVNF